LTKQVVTPPTSLGSISSAILDSTHGVSIASQELAYLPINPLGVDEDEGISEDRAEALGRVVGLLEDEADVVKVWTNLA
jgi:transcriptional/translational regulatory protein YebC/TACO1